MRVFCSVCMIWCLLFSITYVPVTFQNPLAIAAGEEEKPPSPKPFPGRDAPLWDKGQAGQVNLMPAIRKMQDGVLQVEKILVNKREGLISMKGEVNMQEGLVEYLACGARGKLHESVLKLDVEPYHLQIALLLIGLEPGMKPLARQGDTAAPEGDPVEIYVTWMSPQKKMSQYRAEELVLNKATDKPMEQIRWVFTGSQVINGAFMAQVEHTIAALYHDPFAILDHSSATGGDDTTHFANKSILPPKGTPVNFIIRTGKKDRPEKPVPPGPPGRK